MTLTLEEIRRIGDLATMRRNAMRGDGAGWGTFLVQAGLGLLLALFAVAIHAAVPEKAAAIAVGGWLACWAATAAYARTVRRIWQRRQALAWAAIDYSYSIVAGPDGLHVASAQRATMMGWRGLARAESWSGFVLLWTETASPLPIPARAIGSPWSPAGLVERFAAAIRQS